MMCIETIYGNSCMWIGIGIASIFWMIFYIILYYLSKGHIHT